MRHHVTTIGDLQDLLGGANPQQPVAIKGRELLVELPDDGLQPITFSSGERLPAPPDTRPQATQDYAEALDRSAP